MQKIFRALPFLLLLFAPALAQDTLKIMAYNLLNYLSTDGSRDVYYRTIIEAVNPDVLVVEEITSQAAVNNFRNNVLNQIGIGTYDAGTFIDGPDTDNAIFIKQNRAQFVSNTAIRTALRNISEFKLYHVASAETLRLYTVHLKASSGTTNENLRAAEVDSLRKVTNAPPAGKFFMLMGDCNIYHSGEAAYQKLLQDNPGDDGNFIDPLTMPGTWNSGAYAQYHTQSPRVRAFGGGATGGLDDRFDLILYSTAMSGPGNVHYVPGSLIPFGNDGNHYNDSINRLPNTAVSAQVAQALHNASDHLPVSVRVVFDSPPLPILLSAFSGSVVADSTIRLDWTTLSEVNNFGFYVQHRMQGSGSFVELPSSFVPGHGTTTEPQEYSWLHVNASVGTNEYRLRQVGLDSGETFTYAIAVVLSPPVTVPQADEVPNRYQLFQNYPNPFNPITTIRFTVEEAGNAEVSIFGLLGEKIGTLFTGMAVPGKYYDVEFDGGRFGSGVYFYRLLAGGRTLIRPMILVK